MSGAVLPVTLPFTLASDDPAVAVSNPRFILSARVPPRVITSEATAMGRVPDLRPIDTQEIATITADFTGTLAAGQTLSGTPTVLIFVHSGTDPDPSSRLIGPPQIRPSPSTGEADMAVLQQIGNMQGGVVYALQCLAAAAPDTPSLWARIACVQPG